MPSDITGTDVLEEDRTTGRRVFRFVHGPAVRQRHPGRRGQPHPAQDPGRAAAVDAGVPGLGGRHDLRAAPALPGVRHPEPDRAGGDLPAARGPARPVHVPGRRGLPHARRRRSASSARPRPPTAPPCARCCRPSASSSCRTWCCGCRSPITCCATRWRCAGPPGRAPAAVNRPWRRAAVRATTATSRWSVSYVSWGAGPRASQYLVLAAKARAVLHGRYAVGHRGRPGAGAAGADPPGGPQLPRRGRRRHAAGHRRPRGRVGQAGLSRLGVSRACSSRGSRAARPRPGPGPGRAGQPGQPVAARPGDRRGRVLGHAPQPARRHLDGVHRAQGVLPGRRDPPHRLEGGRAGRPLLRQALRGRDRDAHVPGRRRLGARWATGAGASPS